jgi:Uma2 family endonuclease
MVDFIFSSMARNIAKSKDRHYSQSMRRGGEVVRKLSLSSTGRDEKFLAQGRECTVREYLNLETNHLIELVDGRLEVLAMPREWHQFIIGFLYRTLFAFVDAHAAGDVAMAPLKIRVGKRRFREPDVLYVTRQHYAWRTEKYWKGADLAMEVVSPGRRERQRDLLLKRKDYAKAGVSEYWIIDREDQCITVLVLDASDYRTHGTFVSGEKATSVLLPGFAVAVDDVFAAAEGSQPATKRAK